MEKRQSRSRQRKKIQKSEWEDWLEPCRLCPRDCGSRRLSGGKGRCGVSALLKVSRAALHLWEEPCISGTEGSGTVFFSGCPLHCVYCQNRAISDGRAGKEISAERLGEIFLELQGKGARNINLVTPTHYIPQIREALDLAEEGGLELPVVFNCGGYEKPEALKLLDGYVDIYLTDFKYMDSQIIWMTHALLLKEELQNNNFCPIIGLSQDYSNANLRQVLILRQFCNLSFYISTELKTEEAQFQTS